jgi:flagellar motor switch protein FliN/FliY
MTQMADADTDQAVETQTESPQAEAPEAETGAEAAADAVEVRDAALDEVPRRRNSQGAGKIDLLLDTTVEVTATLGSVRMAVGKLLQMGVGSVILLDREAGLPIDVLLNGIPFAKGHLVVVQDRLAVRLTEVEVPEDEEPETDAPDG